MTMIPPKNIRILIIDDNPEIHRDFIKILTIDTSQSKQRLNEISDQLFGASENRIKLPEFIIDSASQGEEGCLLIAAAIKDKDPYALAFVDIRMPPGWDGIETIKKIWEIDPDIQIVICTAYSDYSWEQTIENLGEKENLLILKKPFDQVAVRQLSMALTKKWQLLQENRDHTKQLEQNVMDRTKSLVESLSITRGTLESSIDGILVLNNENTIIDYNHILVEMWNIPNEILESRNGLALLEFISKQLINPNSLLKIFNELHNMEINKEDKFRCLDNRSIELYSQPYKLEEKTAGRIWSFRDITNRALLEEKIHFQAMHDPLTKLPNRELLTHFIKQEIQRVKRDAMPLAIMFFDLDRFKLINDSFNHSIGDELLEAVADRLKENLNTNDMVARLGGDEFVFVITSFGSLNELKMLANNVLDKFKRPFKISNHDIIISPSIGISIFPDNGETVEELVRNADMAMYHAKELGGNQIQLFSSRLNQESLKRLELAMDLNRAVENKEFILCYQPQYDLIQNKLVSVEALIRWNHPTKGLLLPIDFIPLAEEIGIMPVICEWVLRTACLQNKAWQNLGLPPLRIAVNISTAEFKQPNLVALIKQILLDTQLQPEYLELELTENIIITNIEGTSKINKLKDLGVTIAIDDFGTGYSSLNYLR